MATPTKRPPKVVLCPVQVMGVKGYCNAPVVPGQPFCAKHLRKRDRISSTVYIMSRIKRTE